MPSCSPPGARTPSSTGRSSRSGPAEARRRPVGEKDLDAEVLLALFVLSVRRPHQSVRATTLSRDPFLRKRLRDPPLLVHFAAPREPEGPCREKRTEKSSPSRP